MRVARLDLPRRGFELERIMARGSGAGRRRRADEIESKAAAGQIREQIRQNELLVELAVRQHSKEIRIAGLSGPIGTENPLDLGDRDRSCGNDHHSRFSSGRKSPSRRRPIRRRKSFRTGSKVRRLRQVDLALPLVARQHHHRTLRRLASHTFAHGGERGLISPMVLDGEKAIERLQHLDQATTPGRVSAPRRSLRQSGYCCVRPQSWLRQTTAALHQQQR